MSGGGLISHSINFSVISNLLIGLRNNKNNQNLNLLKKTDEIKFVLASRKDYDWALDLIRKEDLENRALLLFSCAWGHLHPKDVAAWMVEDRKDKIRLQLQQHKYIWGPRAKGV